MLEFESYNKNKEPNRRNISSLLRVYTWIKRPIRSTATLQFYMQWCLITFWIYIFPCENDLHVNINIEISSYMKKQSLGNIFNINILDEFEKYPQKWIWKGKFVIFQRKFYFKRILMLSIFTFWFENHLNDTWEIKCYHSSTKIKVKTIFS